MRNFGSASWSIGFLRGTIILPSFCSFCAWNARHIRFSLHLESIRQPDGFSSKNHPNWPIHHHSIKFTINCVFFFVCALLVKLVQHCIRSASACKKWRGCQQKLSPRGIRHQYVGPLRPSRANFNPLQCSSKQSHWVTYLIEISTVLNAVTRPFMLDRRLPSHCRHKKTISFKRYIFDFFNALHHADVIFLRCYPAIITRDVYIQQSYLRDTIEWELRVGNCPWWLRCTATNPNLIMLLWKSMKVDKFF